MKSSVPPTSASPTFTTVTASDLEVDSGTLSVDESNNRVGINTTSPAEALGIDGDISLAPTVISTAHIKTAGSLDVRASGNIKIGTDGADSIRIGRENSSACKVHIRSGSNADLVVTDGKVGIGMEDPSDALEVDGDIQLTPTATSTAHLKTTGSLDVRASGNIKIGTDGADSVRLGRTNSSAVKVHVRSGADTDLVVFNSQIGLGTETPGTQLQVEGTAPYVTLKNSTAENTDGGCESRIVFEDHADAALGQIEVTHSGSADDTKGKMVLSTHTGSTLTAAVTIDESQKVTAAGDVQVTGDIILDDGGSLKEAGGTAAITFDGSGHVTKIGQDSPSSDDVLTYDGSKWVASAPTTGDITGVTAGDGLSGGGTSGGVSLAVDLNELSAAVVAVGSDSIAIIDADDDGSKKESIADLVTAMAGTAATTGLSATSGVLSVSDLHPVGVSGAANQLLTDDGDGTVTSEAKLLCDGATTTIGDGTAEDTMLLFDGNELDFRIGLDDGTNNLEIGVGNAHGTTTALIVDPTADLEIVGSLAINSAIADEKVSGLTAIFTAGEALERGEVVYFKAADSKMWKAVATASATSRCVAMAAEDISADAAGKFLLQGFLQDNGTFPAYTVGGALYTPEAETSGQNVPEQTAPDSDGDFVQILGWAVTANMVYFNPSGDIIEVA
jgi:hypothetical protein